MGTGLSRLIRHRTTVDPYLDESGPAARRIPEVSFEGVVHDAIALSGVDGFDVDVRTVSPATLHVPCAVRGKVAAGVTFEVAVSLDDRTLGRRAVRIDATGANRWHVLSLRVPKGRPTIAIGVRAEGGAGQILCGVPVLSWPKSPAAIARSVAFVVRAHGVFGAIAYIRERFASRTPERYSDWAAEAVSTPDALARARSEAAALAGGPRFALVLEAVGGADASAVEHTIASIREQVYGSSELWIPEAHEEPAALRNRVLGTSTADFVAAIAPGDRLSPLALLRAAQRIVAAPETDILYTDEDEREADGSAARARFKPDWSPEYLLSCMYAGRLLAVRRTLATDVGGYRACADGVWDFDLCLRAAQRARAVAHVSEVLYHRHATGPGHPDSAGAAAAAAIADACTARGLMPAGAAPGALPGIWRPRITIAEHPRIAIVIPTDARGVREGAPPLVLDCIRRLRERTRYPHYEIVVCDNGNLPSDARQALDTMPHRRITYRWEGAFNFPRKINFAVAQSTLPYVLLLNDDVEPINADWLEAMLEYAHQPQIGAVGAKLFYPDGRLQHVGVAVGVCGIAAHLLHQQPGGSPGCGGIAMSVRNCAAVTGACLLTRRRVYEELGGFDEALPLDFNDVDFCLRAGRAGYRIVFTPHARLFHHESATFGWRRQNREEIAVMRRKWGAALERDPYYNVNFSRDFPDCRVSVARQVSR